MVLYVFVTLFIFTVYIIIVAAYMHGPWSVTNLACEQASGRVGNFFPQTESLFTGYGKSKIGNSVISVGTQPFFKEINRYSLIHSLIHSFIHSLNFPINKSIKQ